MIKAYWAVRFEQQREETNSVTEIGLIEVRLLEDTFAAIAGGVKPIEQAFYRLNQRLA